jgi:hypothetical protein
VNSNPDTYNDGRGENAGWIAGFLVIAAVVAIGAVFWFTYHP